ncbi:hypothetical protein JD276_06075 [Leucobacter sp. CSA1]|uniref:Uncharacterized protein n=1 Tax=Leucobacter chromiisoli TaxID=2796471 RepID=A0A934Q751_9MICO|nr:hypothetical protein [Leucobacter chromiisoli]MBK0418600.1 hypothetical protein [Leucobacter chromiisoli]
MTEERREEGRKDTAEPAVESTDAPPVESDVVSDPARSDDVGSDWSTEGGATPDGPATAETAGEEEGEEGLPRITLDPPD